MTPTTCWICGGATCPTALLDPFSFVECAACGFVFCPELDQDATRAIYEGGDYQQRLEHVDEGLTADRMRNAESRLRWVLEVAPATGRLLDIGAAAGAFVAAAGSNEFDAFGIEPSPEFAHFAREHLGLDVRDGRLEDLVGLDTSIDVITMWHVLEHIPQPVRALETAHRLLKPGGLLILEVPNADSIMAHRLGLAWTGSDPAVHVSQFTRSTLAAALAAAHFEVVDLHTVSHAVYQDRREQIRSLPHRLQLLRGGAPRTRHADRHEYLRAVARRQPI